MSQERTVHNHIIARKSVAGWGGLEGVTTFIEYQQYNNQRGFHFKVGDPDSLGTVYSNDEYTPTNLKEIVAEFEKKHVEIGPLAQAALAMADKPIPGSPPMNSELRLP